MSVKDKSLPRAYLESIIERSVDAIVTIDEKGIIEYVNPATTVLFGYDEAEMLGHNVSMLMPSPDRERHDDYINRYLQTGKRKIIGIGREVMAMHKSGKLFPVRLAVSEAWIEDKRIFIGTIHDISEVKEAQQKIIELNRELEKRVAERTEELARVVNKLLDANQKLLHEVQERKAVEEALRRSEAELKQALEKEKELSELKSRFVTMASHEFRTPLTSILSSADLIEAYTTDPNDKRRKHVMRIKSAVNNLITILNDFLSLSKLEENRIEPKMTKFDLKDFLRELHDEMRPLLKNGQQIQMDNRTRAVRRRARPKHPEKYPLQPPVQRHQIFSRKPPHFPEG
ncbi:MAG: hypothetical protein KatS3mg029_0644 [Saprospiraceae bacterium]|nr:MAG: hypothetical protein KatS3mg029_0644 [Saprospiraceae bacterium]